MIRLGTSGFSYDDWIGEVYPEDIPRWSWLSFYAERFDTVELNVTYYRIPERKMVKGWVDRTPDDFLFSIKAHRSLTHERKSPDFSRFIDSLEPIINANKLACVLAQFPHSFHPTDENREYLRAFRLGMGDITVVIEFRDAAWVTEGTFDELRDLDFGYCCVDEPGIPGLMPPVAEATSEVAYIRFHGRNAARWYDHDQAWERYDYTYSESELKEWIPRIRELERTAPLTLVYANNHYRGQSVDTIKKLDHLLVPEDNE